MSMRDAKIDGRRGRAALTAVVSQSRLKTKSGVDAMARDPARVLDEFTSAHDMAIAHRATEDSGDRVIVAGRSANPIALLDDGESGAFVLAEGDVARLRADKDPTELLRAPLRPWAPFKPRAATCC